MSGIADYLNEGVAKLVAMGREKASLLADEVVNKYQAERRLTSKFGSIDTELKEIGNRPVMPVCFLSFRS